MKVDERHENNKKNAYDLADTPNDEKTGGRKARPYGFRGISVSSVGAGFTPARFFQKNIHDLAVTPNDENRPLL